MIDKAHMQKADPVIIITHKIDTGDSKYFYCKGDPESENRIPGWSDPATRPSRTASRTAMKGTGRSGSPPG